MIRGLYTAVSGMITQEAKQDVITNNLANANTVGYKGDNLAIKKFEDTLIANYDKRSASGKQERNIIGSLSMGSKIDETNTDFTQGMIQDTGKTTDFAIEGSGFFTVNKLSDGKTAYTRDGHFHVNGSGFLVTDSGDAVLGKNAKTNATEAIYVGSGKLSLNQNGVLSVSGGGSYRFNTVDFQNYKALQKVGDNLYEGGTPIQSNNVTVKQKALEKANINVINEMVNMLTVTRSFESSQKVVQAMDETLGKAVNDVGKV